MSIQQLDKIDFVSFKNSEVYLTISDHLDWNSVEDHLLLLQNKINVYLDFYQGGGLYEKFPQYKNKRIVIQVSGKFSLPEEGRDFFDQTNDQFKQLGIKLIFIDLSGESFDQD